MNLETLREKRGQLVAACEEYATTNSPDAVAKFDAAGEPSLSFEDVDTSLIPPRPRLYGLVGAEVIEEAWKDRQKKPAVAAKPQPALAAAH